MPPVIILGVENISAWTKATSVTGTETTWAHQWTTICVFAHGWVASWEKSPPEGCGSQAYMLDLGGRGNSGSSTGLALVPCARVFRKKELCVKNTKISSLQILWDPHSKLGTLYSLWHHHSDKFWHLQGLKKTRVVEKERESSSSEDGILWKPLCLLGIRSA